MRIRTLVLLILAYLLLVSLFTLTSKVAGANYPWAVPWVGVEVDVLGGNPIQHVLSSDYFYVMEVNAADNWSTWSPGGQAEFLDPKLANFTLETNSPGFQDPPMTQGTYYDNMRDLMFVYFGFQFHPGDLAPGTYSFTGKYTTAWNFTDIEAITLVVSLSESPKSTTLVFSSPNLVSICQSVNCSATVSGSNPTGTITWSTSSNTGNFSQSVCTLSNGTCSTTYIDNLTGSVTVAAYYSGDSNNAPSSGSTTLTVTSGGPIYYSANYTSVQAAINAAPPGATVIIAPGFYNESLTLNKPSTIIGEKDMPVFSGGASAIFLTLLSGASGSNITGIEITNVAEGILVNDASNVSIYGNIMVSIGGSGIVLEGNNATDNVIYGNIFQDVPTPINVTASAGSNSIYGNIITSQTSVTLNIGADGNSVYGNSISGNEIFVNMTGSNGNVVYHNNFLTAIQITVAATGNNTWDDGNPSGGNYWSIAPSFVGSNNTDHYPLTEPWPLATGHCISVISVVTAKTVIGQGFNCSLTVCAADNGEYAESFNVTAYVNNTAIGTRQVSSLNASCQIVFTFAWNTTGLAYGNYTVSAYAQPVVGQTEVSGNDFTLGTLKVTIPGDINGDFKVGLPDLVLLAQAYNSKPGDSNWNSNADIKGDGVVDLADLVILTQHYGQHSP